MIAEFIYQYVLFLLLIIAIIMMVITLFLYLCAAILTILGGLAILTLMLYALYEIIGAFKYKQNVLREVRKAVMLPVYVTGSIAAAIGIVLLVAQVTIITIILLIIHFTPRIGGVDHIIFNSTNVIQQMFNLSAALFHFESLHPQIQIWWVGLASIFIGSNLIIISMYIKDSNLSLQSYTH